MSDQFVQHITYQRDSKTKIRTLLHNPPNSRDPAYVDFYSDGKPFRRKWYIKGEFSHGYWYTEHGRTIAFTTEFL